MTSMELSRQSQRHLAFVSLSLGFLVIWTAVLAGVLISKTLKDDASSKAALGTLKMHEDIAKVTFALGHEMVSTVDWLLSDSSPGESSADQRALALTWQVTDDVLASASSDPGTTARLVVFRQTVRRNFTSPLDTSSFYLSLCNTLLHRHLFPSSPDEPSATLAHALFVRGMSLRMGQLALGTTSTSRSTPAWVRSAKSYLKPPFTLDHALAHAGPNCRKGGPRLALDDVAEDMAGGGTRKAKLAPAFLEEVKQQLALLLMAREVLGNSLQAWAQRGERGSRAALAFHSSIAGVALVAVLLCLIVVGCLLRDLGARECKPDLAPIIVPPEKSHCYM
ncbi:hypothetical protein HPB52_010927 [Rhipicephalus sanguineus]|uniref:Uncharacterized protein n=1 Tax=Rhipicephalus sanguineus TaxID=34632 RepID=A0A9D4PSK6_RHISA|nr:hypothetical protein HPB52_010927 [Rhipicephalus sanguineus]